MVGWNWRQDESEQLVDTFAGAAVGDPTGRLLATTRARSGSQVVDVWDAASGNRVAVLPGHTATVTDLAFNPDGSRLATASEDGTIRVWEADSGEQVVVLRGHGAATGSVAISPGGSQLASVGADGLVRIWALDVEDAVAIAEREVTRTLTDAECRQHLHTDRCPRA